MRNISGIIMLLATCFLLASCNPLVRKYRPLSGKEGELLRAARMNVFPQDVRNAPLIYNNAMVAWAGIVVERKFIKRQDHTEAQFVLMHHYFDWIETPGFEDERIHLSRHGEGLFRTSWLIKSNRRFEKVKKSSGNGNLLIVYGTPSEVEADGTIVLSSRYLRAFDKKYFSAEKRAYGRSEEPVETLASPQASAREGQ